jgi:hypothetical protein
VLRHLQDRARCPALSQPVVPAGRDGPAGRHGEADRPADRHVGIQRGVLRRRALRPRMSSANRARAGKWRWRCSAFERGASTLGQQIGFENEFKEILAVAKDNGAAKDPVMRQRLAQAWIELQLVRLNAVTNLEEGTTRPGLAAINKLCWATWHRDAGELAMEVMGADAEICAGAPYALTRFQSRFLFSRSDTIYGGTNEIQRNIIAEQAWACPGNRGLRDRHGPDLHPRTGRLPRRNPAVARSQCAEGKAAVARHQGRLRAAPASGSASCTMPAGAWSTGRRNMAARAPASSTG